MYAFLMHAPSRRAARCCVRFDERVKSVELLGCAWISSSRSAFERPCR